MSRTKPVMRDSSVKPPTVKMRPIMQRPRAGGEGAQNRDHHRAARGFVLAAARGACTDGREDGLLDRSADHPARATLPRGGWSGMRQALDGNLQAGDPLLAGHRRLLAGANG